MTIEGTYQWFSRARTLDPANPCTIGVYDVVNSGSKMGFKCPQRINRQLDFIHLSP